MKWTDEKLSAKTPGERHQLYMNAMAMDSDDARALVRMIEDSGLAFSLDRSLRKPDAVSEKIAGIAFSADATKAMEDAIRNGLPPMAALDPMLIEALGEDYGTHNSSTTTAGRIAAERMIQRGYQKTGKKQKLPADCRAKTADVLEKAPEVVQ
ncbi:MAG: hypothetical protein H7Y08_10405 [Rhizobiaceae bacterium]|nr:hypothetical protein [Rhizobiaceae bacterium]